MRRKFINWLRFDVLKHDEATIPPKWMNWIYWVLYPLRSMYERNSHVKYEWHTDKYTIRGVELRGNMIELLGHCINQPDSRNLQHLVNRIEEEYDWNQFQDGKTTKSIKSTIVS